jgi:hypothetical protein
MVLVPNPHYFVHAATVNTTGQAAHLLDEVMEKRRAGHKFLVVDITIQGLIQSKDQLGHVITSYSLNASKNRKTDAAIGHPNRHSTRLSDIAAMAPCGTKCHFSAAWNLVAAGHNGH